MKEVNIYLVSGIRSMRKQSGWVAYCLEYYPENSKYPKTLVDVEQVENMTGRRAELDVLVKALKRLKEECVLSIYTESSYLAMGIGEQRLVDRWKKNGWKAGKNVEVKNEDKWKEILNLLNSSIYKVYVNTPNAYVDMLHEKIKMKGEIRNV